VEGSLVGFCWFFSVLHFPAFKGFHFFIGIPTILFFQELHHFSFPAMPTLITFVIHDGKPTMTPSIPASNTIPIPGAPKLKTCVQVKLNGDLAVHVSKSVTVPSFRKKNGTLVASHTWHVSINKSKSAKKVLSHKKKKATNRHHSTKFEAQDDCKESVSLAYSLRIQEVQNLMKPNPYNKS
jgi:hypothetical protein